MLDVLLVDDDENSIGPVVRYIERTRTDIGTRTCGFGDARAEIATSRPDIVVLDLFAGAVTDDRVEGLGTRDFIWSQHFCPVVVYSAAPEAHIGNWEMGNHPFVKCVKKGRRSEFEVASAVDELRPHVEALKATEASIARALGEAMKEVAQYVFQEIQDGEQRKEAIVRGGRRRVAALMDEPLDGTAPLAPWEVYLCPPICSDLRVGDVLREVARGREPEAFRIVLTPSCDLVRTGGQEPKVQEVLVARCCTPKKGLRETSYAEMSMAKLRDRLVSSVLSPGVFEGIVPLAGLAGKIPTMVAKVRDLELIPIRNIGENQKFERVASVDAPFRESIVWAYLQTSCRPGVPDRNFADWRDELMESIQAEVPAEDE